MNMETDAQRLSSCLSRLLPHLDRHSVALTGGVAIELHLAAAAKHGRRERIADVDFMASRLDVIAPTVASVFLISHYHVARRGVPRGMIQLVDPVTGLRLDIFPDLAGALSRAKHMLVAGEVLLVLEPQSMLEHKLQTLAKPPVDEKHWLDAVALAALCAAPSPPRLAQFMPDRYSTDFTLVCDRCDRSRSPRFPLAPKANIFELLGYV